MRFDYHDLEESIWYHCIEQTSTLECEKKNQKNSLTHFYSPFSETPRRPIFPEHSFKC